MGGMPTGMDPAAAASLMQDPDFMTMASEFATHPELMEFTMRAQQAIQSGDPAAMMTIASDPAMARVQQIMMQNPGLMQRMVGAQMGGAGGNPLAAMFGAQMAGAGGPRPADGFHTPTQPPRATPQTPAAPRQAPATDPPAPSPPVPTTPGVPTTEEEEERLLQEAIRLSMQEGERKADDKPSEGGSGTS
jgi:hypothetical protein